MSASKQQEYMDIVIVSCGKNETLRTLTQNTINSCINSGDNFKFYVIETCLNFSYKYATTINYKREVFNYNHCLNVAFRYCKNKYIAFCNNDLLFEKNWAKNMLHVFKAHNYLSLSPYEPRIHKGRHGAAGNHLIEGHQIATHITGWCICVDRDIFKKIKQFNESVDFWYSDNIYGDQLKKHNIKHALVCNSIVRHLESQTLKRETHPMRHRLTTAQTAKYFNAKKKL